MKTYGKRLLLLALSLILILFFKIPTQAQECDRLCELGKQIDQYASEVKRLQSQANTLSNQIAQFDAQIKLTQLKINQTEEQIILLGGRIDQLDLSIGKLTEAFSMRAVETYKMSKSGEPAFLILSASNLRDVVSSFHYLRMVQEADRDLLVRLQSAQNTYKEQKSEQEKLQVTLKDQKKTLDSQKTAKNYLLSVTRNDEKKYQQLLASAQAELAAITAIVAGRGNETEVRQVSEGERIASILTSGPNLYACSSGAHLHFEVVRSGSQYDPFSFLSSKSLVWDNIDPAQNGRGSWQWPLSDPIRITQGFGHTSYSSIYAGSLHTGVDMVNQENLQVKAVKPGKLFRGGISCRGGTLQYVHVKQDDGYDTYYLHVNY